MGPQTHILVWCRVWISGDQSEPSLLNSRTLPAEKTELPDRCINGIVVHSLLHPVQDCLPLCLVGFGYLLIEQPIDIEIAPIGIGAALHDEFPHPSGCVA